MSAAEMKPCPFCGGEPVLDGRSEDVRVRCEGCDAHAATHWFGDDLDAVDAAEAAAISAWNARA
jgi:Lar family restriction alleviation protein